MDNKPRAYHWELIINFALVYSIFIGIILLPYVFLRGFFSSKFFFWSFIVYGLIIIFYVILWIIDKLTFFKDEITN